jgi:hypothetical protein
VRWLRIDKVNGGVLMLIAANRGFMLVALVGVTLGAARTASAQCGYIAYNQIATTPGNPFQAERVTTFSPQVQGRVPLAMRAPELVARDGQGRVRTERAVGNYRIKTGEEAGADVEQRLIAICDPSTGTLTQLDTLAKTAKIRRAAAGAARSATQSRQPFCHSGSNLAKGAATFEDLGHKSIEGLDAQGVRITMNHIAADGAAFPPMVHEEWCSEELAAMVLRVMYDSSNEHQQEITLKNIQRGEPDPTLFQTPPDYAVSESLDQPPRPLSQSTFAAPNSK